MHRWVRKRRWWQTLCATSSSPGRTLQPSSHARHRIFHNFFLWLYNLTNRPKTFYVFLITSLYPYQASNTKQTHPVATDTHVILNCERRYNIFCVFFNFLIKVYTLICCKTKYGDYPHVAMPPTYWLGDPGKYNIFCIVLIFWLKLAALIVKCSSASHWLGDENIIFSLLSLFSD